MAAINVTDYGVLPGGSPSGNMNGFTAAFTAASPGDTMLLPAGKIDVGVSGLAGGRGVLMNKPITFKGAGRGVTTLAADAAVTGGVATNWRLAEIVASSVTLEDLTLSGSKPTNPGAFSDYDANVEHHAGIFAGPSISDFTLRRVDIRDFEGDGLQVYSGVTRPMIEYCDFRYNQRSGLSFTPTSPSLPVRDAIVRYCTFGGIAGQPVDNEHGPVYGCDVYGNKFDAGVNNYAVTCSGYATVEADEAYGQPNRSKNWRIYDNDFGQAIFLIRCDDVEVYGNRWNTPHTKPCVDISRSATNITIRDNDMVMTQTTTGSVACVLATGTTEDSDGAGPLPPWYPYPKNIYISGNRMTVTGHASSYGVRLQACESVVVCGNELTGPGASASTFSGIFLRATIAARDFTRAVVSGNRVYNWGHRGISVGGNGAAKLLYAEITANKVANLNGATAMSQGISLDDTTGALQAALLTENSFGTGIVTGIANVPVGATIAFARPVEPQQSKPAGFLAPAFVGGWE